MFTSLSCVGDCVPQWCLHTIEREIKLTVSIRTLSKLRSAAVFQTCSNFITSFFFFDMYASGCQFEPLWKTLVFKFLFPEHKQFTLHTKYIMLTGGQQVRITHCTLHSVYGDWNSSCPLMWLVPFMTLTNNTNNIVVEQKCTDDCTCACENYEYLTSTWNEMLCVPLSVEKLWTPTCNLFYSLHGH